MQPQRRYTCPDALIRHSYLAPTANRLAIDRAAVEDGPEVPPQNDNYIRLAPSRRRIPPVASDAPITVKKHTRLDREPSKPKVRASSSGYE